MAEALRRDADRRVRHALARTELHDRDRLAVSPTDAQRLAPDHPHARRIPAALVQDVGERPDRRRLAAPPTGRPANPLALGRHAAGDVSPARLVARAVRAGSGREDEKQCEKQPWARRHTRHVGPDPYRVPTNGVNENAPPGPRPGGTTVPWIGTRHL